MAMPKLKKNRLEDYEQNGLVISAAVCEGYSTGCQFHPEKSGSSVLKIIKKFISS